ncbi:hypothetical protein N656DRAFT_782908 [Canariomyces notabilis]|uniref:Secreted protein n=1 Tax=Canariomyces notabilis TaxID=2074819 RepID=A0AAN6QG86_9PEZI|nr:hypothetical protein N656DRAFT_782908 [Canariomyces arenarius]
MTQVLVNLATAVLSQLSFVSNVFCQPVPTGFASPEIVGIVKLDFHLQSATVQCGQSWCQRRKNFEYASLKIKYSRRLQDQRISQS